MSVRDLSDLDRDIAQPLGRILQEAFGDGIGCEVIIGATSAGYDFTLWGSATASKVIWDASADQFGVGTFALPQVTTSTNNVRMIVSGNSAVDTGASTTVRNFWSRCKISAAQTTGGSQYGSENQLRVASPTANYAISSAGVYAGAWDYFEASDTDYDVTFTNLKAIGCHAKLEISTNHTVSSGKFHGVNIGNAVVPTMASATEFVGLFIEKDSGAQDWTVGIDINDMTTGIDIGACTTGISISGATTTGISITGGATTCIATSGTMTAASGRAAKFQGTVATANYGDGYGFVEVELSVTGTQAGHASSFTAWINIGEGTGGTGGTFYTAQNNGIWEAAGATITDTVLIYGMRMQCVLGDSDSINYPFSLNMSGGTMKALFHCASTTDIGLVTDAGSDDGTLVPLYTTDNSTVHYVKVYSHS